MFRILLTISLFFQFSFAFLTTKGNFNKEVQILSSLDMDNSFLRDKMYMSMKENLDEYRTKHFLKVLEKGYVFVPILRKMISESGIPDAFLYLAMAESNFSARAYSRARAVGLWQFMPATARNFGLKINIYTDERRDPIKSTKAAIKYLKRLHERFGKWYLAAIAYNCGEGRLARAIKRAGTDNLNVLLNKRKRYIPKESRVYIRKIAMMAYASNDTNFILENDAGHLLNRGSTFSLSKIFVKGGSTIYDIAQSIGVSPKELKSYNTHLRYFFLPPNEDRYQVYIPYSKLTEFKQNFKPTKNSKKFMIHVIKKGDTLYDIGRRYGVSYRVIKDYNKLRSNNLRLGKKLVIPVMKLRKRQYIIKKGDSLALISRKFNVKLKALMQANNLKNSFIKPGVRIVIPD